MYKLSDYSYELPSEFIAQQPADPAESAKLLIPSSDGSFSDKDIRDLPDVLGENDVLFFNDTRVVQARIPLTNIRVVTKQGREVLLENAEIFFLEKLGEYRCEVLISLLKRNRPGTIIYITDTIYAEIKELTNKGLILEFVGITVDDLMKQYGKMPLPPYIPTSTETEKKYQTVFAKHDGSVAAPTASLHFTNNLLQRISTKGAQINYVTLHVGLGTFKPVDTEDIRDYAIHDETIIIEKSLFSTIAKLKKEGKNIVAVGTTVARVLETLPYVWNKLRITNYEGGVGEFWNTITKNIPQIDIEKYIMEVKEIEDDKLQIKTRIFIYPGFQWKIVDMLMTNFHLPGSTLLMLVASFVGYDKVMKIYKHAIQYKYRFFSFGDAMLLKRKP